MAEFPILMSGFSVRATLEGKKTQTRRVIRPQPELGKHWKHGWIIDPDEVDIPMAYCPYGIRWDYLYVRETWCDALTEADYTGSPDDHGGENDPCCGYRATMTYRCGKPIPENPLRKWKSSIHMPKKHARLWLVNEGTGVERVQGISKADAIAEGIRWSKAFPEGYTIDTSTDLDGSPVGGNYKIRAYDAIQCFAKLWNSINEKPRPVIRKGKVVSYVSFPWEAVRETREYRGKLWEVYGNPWIWRVKYRMLEKQR